MLRPEVVEMLCEHALDAMQAHGEGTSADEMVSACMTLALKAVKLAVQKGWPLEPFKQGVARIYAEFPAEKVN